MKNNHENKMDEVVPIEYDISKCSAPIEIARKVKLAFKKDAE